MGGGGRGGTPIHNIAAAAAAVHDAAAADSGCGDCWLLPRMWWCGVGGGGGGGGGGCGGECGWCGAVALAGWRAARRWRLDDRSAKRRCRGAFGREPAASTGEGGSTTARSMVVAENGGSHHMIGENDHDLRARSPAESQQPAALRRTSESRSDSSGAAAA